MKDNKFILLTESQVNILDEQRLIQECTIAAVRLDAGNVIAKNRDRGYLAKMEIVHEIVDDVEMMYWRDIETDWSEGINEYGIGIINSSLLVRQDEKESNKVFKSKNVKKSNDGKKIRHALKFKNLKDVIKSIISYDADDPKSVGVKGQTIVGSPKNIYIIELTSKDTPVVTKMGDDKVEVRTNHGIVHKKTGYIYGIKKKSSHSRLVLAKKHLQDTEKDQDVIDKMKEQYKKNKFLNPYRTKNMYNMQTVGQIMMNLDKKQVTIRMDNEMGEFVGINSKLPKGYKPKISVRIEGEKVKNEKGKKLPS
jgi:hypothetical protein